MSPQEKTAAEKLKSWKQRVHFVLVEPREAGNIGSAARAIKNLGFSKLELVNPAKGKFPSEEATWFAHGALNILNKARAIPTLEEALKGKSFVVGASRRAGRDRGKTISLREAAPLIRAAAARNKVAILMGREDRGLTNDETAHCAFLLSIPASREMPSYNLAQAVLLTAYELAYPCGAEKEKIPRLAPHEDLLYFFDRAKGLLDVLEYERGDRDLGSSIFRNLRSILYRASLEEWELAMLHGLLAQVTPRLVAQATTTTTTAQQHKRRPPRLSKNNNPGN
ncbi:MAG: TrmJ/YjtD family RNA methyltransferase [Actinomycetota bacterium]|nr:TrmJ/YjtD family RNA methyltransferase [Actinomycetota bacterium]